jgi:hypothetical protein
MKAIRSKADLAINGAPPAFAELVYVGRLLTTDAKLVCQHS